MKILTFNNEDDWLEGRKGKITGTRAKNVITFKGNERKKGFWELVAERVALAPDGENPMERGKRLEKEAIAIFAKETGKKVNTDLILCVSDDDPNIAYSPDGLIGKTEDVEVKCINSASHIEALITQKIPQDYDFQVLQAFIVNPQLKKRYIVFYDPRIQAKPFFYLTVDRKDVEEDVKKYFEEELKIIKEVEEITLKLTF